MEQRDVVTCFLRHEGQFHLLRRSEEVGSYRGRWGAVTGHADGDPARAAREEIREETGLDPEDVTLVRRGEAFTVRDAERGTEWVVHPFLFEAATQAVTLNWETDSAAWVAPTAILHRETVPDLWQSYERVRPTKETITRDREHGAASLSVRALEVLRDEAAIAAYDSERSELAAKARALVDARPSMPVVANRVNRVMAADNDADPRAVEHAAAAGIDHALTADRRAARAVADRLTDRRVATLSRSGTVLAALRIGDPSAVLVAESRPGREGVGVAESLAEECPVTLTTDAGFGHALSKWDAEVLLIGADAVLADGRVVNKVGTRAAAICASYEGIHVFLVAASDKLTAETDPDLHERVGAEVYDGDATLSVTNATFDVTPADCIDGVVTEEGFLDGDAIAAVIEGHQRRAQW